LGLAISKQLINMMNGEISVESVLGAGSTFSFSAIFRQITAEQGFVENVPKLRTTDCSALLDKNDYVTGKSLQILVVEDDPVNLSVLTRLLERKGHTVESATNGSEALVSHGQNLHDVIFMDIQMPVMDGIEATVRIRDREGLSGHTPIIALTAYALPRDREKLLSYGMDEYISKPIQAEELFLKLERVVAECHTNTVRKQQRSRRDLQETYDQLGERSVQFNLYHSKRQHAMDTLSMGIFSEKLEEIVNQAYKYATIRSFPIVIQGETGTGKEFIAKIIHYGESDRAKVGPFIDLNCAAINSNLFESELFGYEAGAYTGGSPKGKKGKLDLAQGGTLFLDELGELSLESQGKLLRVLQEKEFYRVGGLKKISTNARIVAATNMNLEQAMNEGRFRKDLYYRLKIGMIVIPPLRERKEEILPLAIKFLMDFAQKEG
jgi:DNA-binding NtrC family response regulator